MTYLCNDAAFTIPHHSFLRFTSATLLLGCALPVWDGIGVPRVDRTVRIDNIPLLLGFATITLLVGFALQVWVDIGVLAPCVDRTLRVDNVLRADRIFLALE